MRIRKHLFLKLYKHNFGGFEKPLTEYIQDFDKTKDISYFKGYSLVKFKKFFRNLDELMLFKDGVVNTIFVVKYMTYLQSVDTYKDISLQELYELSLLTDEDFHPKDDAFKFAYISDSRRKEIVTFSYYYRFLLWDSLVVTDLEFSRRITECLVNSLPSNNHVFTLDDGFGLNSPFIDYKKSLYNQVSQNTLVDKQGLMYKELSDLESNFLSDIDAPNTNVFFDGNRITVMLSDSPISMMFDLKSNPTKYTINKVKNHNQEFVIEHPTDLQPSFIDRKKSESASKSWWNGRTSWDYNLRDIYDDTILRLDGNNSETELKDIKDTLKTLSFISLLKYGGKIKSSGKQFKIVMLAYIKKRNAIKSKYASVIKAQRGLTEALLTSYKNREIAVYYKTSNGYVVGFYKPYKRSISRKVDSRAMYFDNDLNLVGVSAFYSDTIMNDKIKKDYYEGNGNKVQLLTKGLYEETFKNLFSDSNPIAIDYNNNGVSMKVQLKNIRDRVVENDGSHKLSVWSLPTNMIKTKLKDTSTKNWIGTYVKHLENAISLNGYVDVKNYNQSVKWISENKLKIKLIHSREYEIPEKYSAITSIDDDRYIVNFKVNGRVVDTERYSSFKYIVPISDVEYINERDVHNFNKANKKIKDRFDELNMCDTHDYNTNFLEDRKRERYIKKYIND